MDEQVLEKSIAFLISQQQAVGILFETRTDIYIIAHPNEKCILYKTLYRSLVHIMFPFLNKMFPKYIL